ncbi:Na+/H+ antiporter subunit E [Amaricoccus sp.]|uniref:Na+/H+ antiporter subunit E n=1 Tax=Amaricoccus sp. TaxID=1872485 RepID=UPI001B696850|nr:Na+/H+ antiporter subunit E [Amaricoccus sp.]MBP7242290.1 Na+/H+ antiporter subunit E [Amaricoccus sp.]
MKRVLHWPALGVAFLRDLVLSSVQVARAVVAPGDITRPRFVVVPLRAQTDLEIAGVANYITLTPGTLTVDVSADRSCLLVHDIFAGQSGDGTRAGVTDGIEARVLRAMRK